MKKKDFVILCLRLLGIYFIVIGLSSLPSAASFFNESFELPVYIIISPFIYILCGLVICICAPYLSAYMVAFSEAEEDNIHITASEKTTRVALLVLGVYIFSQVLPQLIKVGIDVGSYYKSYSEIPEHLRSVKHKWFDLIGPVVKLIISIVLIIGPDKLLSLISRYDETFKKIKSSNQAINSD